MAGQVKTWPRWQRRKPDADLGAEIASYITDGVRLKNAARLAGVPPGLVNQWLREGREQLERIYESEDGRGHPGEVGMFAQIVDHAAGRLVHELVQKLKDAGAGKDSSPGSAAWLLERTEEDFNLAHRVEMTGPEGGPLQVEGKVAIGWADLIALAQKTGQGHLLGLASGSPDDALPAAPALLPDSTESESAAALPPGVPGS